MRTLDAKTIIKGLGVAVVVSIMSIVAVSLFTSSSDSFGSVSSITTSSLVFAIISVACMWCVQAWRTEVLLKAYGFSIGLLPSMTAYMGSCFVSHITPFSSGGVPALIYLLHRRGVPAVQATAVVMVQSSLTLVFLLLLSPVLLLVHRVEAGYSGTGIYMTFTLVVILTIFGGYLLLVPKATITLITCVTERGFGARLVRRFGWEEVVTSLTARLGKWLVEFSESLASLWVDKRASLLLSCALAVIYWVSYVATVPIIIRGLGVEVSIIAAVLPQLILNLFQVFIPTPGGSGGTEIGFASLYAVIIPNEHLMTLVLVWRLITYYLRMALGGLALLYSFRLQQVVKNFQKP